MTAIAPDVNNNPWCQQRMMPAITRDASNASNNPRCQLCPVMPGITRNVSNNDMLWNDVSLTCVGECIVDVSSLLTRGRCWREVWIFRSIDGGQSQGRKRRGPIREPDVADFFVFYYVCRYDLCNSCVIYVIWNINYLIANHRIIINFY